MPALDDRDFGVRDGEKLVEQSAGAQDLPYRCKPAGSAAAPALAQHVRRGAQRDRMPVFSRTHHCHIHVTRRQLEPSDGAAVRLHNEVVRREDGRNIRYDSASGLKVPLGGCQPH